MAYTEITGGDGDTGQTGEEIKDILNETHVELYDGIITRDPNRTWTETLVFDVIEQVLTPHVMSGAITFELGGGGHLTGKICAAVMDLTTDGVSPINFSGDFTYIYGIENGDILPAGTFEVFFLYRDGKLTANIPGNSSQASGLTKLSTPGSFAAVADGENAIDLSWTDVDNEVEYQVEKSLTGVGAWSVLETLAAGSTSATETGLNPGDIVYYRIKAIGDNVLYLDSLYATTSAQTENTGDVSTPTFTFNPVNASSTHPINKPMTITANEPIRNADGSEITDANVADVITLKQTNSGGTDITFTATINGSKTIITITPTTQYGASQLVYVAIHDVEDNDGNEIVSPSSITFTTTDYTWFNGTSNRIQFGDILDSLFAAVDTNFWLGFNLNNAAFVGVRVLWAKLDSGANERAFVFFTDGTDVRFNFYSKDGTGNYTMRGIRWAGATEAGVWVLKYNGAVDTSDGLDRVVLEIDSVVKSKTLFQTEGVLPVSILNSPAYLSFGVSLTSTGVPVASQFFSGEVKDLIIRSSSGATLELDVPNLISGTDVSGNGRNGTWV